MKKTSDEYGSKVKPVWCAGCGNYAVLGAVKRSLAALGIAPHDVAVISGIGCAGRLSHYLKTYSLHGTHGRALPTALGAKAARPDLTVLAVGGDGDGLGIGGGHISHAARKNVDITYIMVDNAIYGLTKGQASPTTPAGHKTKTTPYGVYEDTVSAIPIFLAYDISFVARAALDIDALTEAITAAMRHPGMAMVYVISRCQAFPAFDYKEVASRFAPLPDGYDPTDKLKALELAYSVDPVYTGIFYRVTKPVLGRRLEEEIRRAEAGTGGKEASIEQLLRMFA
jgi:2-oxoglutarate ferredoxin oxidoreductase subunit beta